VDHGQPQNFETRRASPGSRLLGHPIFTEPESGNIVPGVFTPVLAKHSKSFSLIDCIAVGVDRTQRNFEPMRKQVEAWEKSELTDVRAKVVIYEAFVEKRVEAPIGATLVQPAVISHGSRQFFLSAPGAKYYGDEDDLH
jgi:hypothetical protein